MRKLMTPVVVGVVLLAVAGVARADTILFTELSGANEVPPVHTDGTGFAVLYIPDEMDFIYFYVEFRDLNSPATMAHIHEGVEGTNGPVLFDLGLKHGGKQGTLEGILTAHDFHPGGHVRTFEEALQALIEGYTYVNVHSHQHPGGEIRGQLLVFE